MADVDLAKEAAWLHRSLFGRDPSGMFVNRYLEANRRLFPDAASAEFQAIRYIVDRQLDCLAIEFAQRQRTPHGALSAKLRVAVYLAETTTGHFDDFTNSHPRLLRAWLALIVAGGRAMVLALKGYYLVKRHHLA